VKWAIDAAPIAANAYWHRDIWRDVRTRSPSERTRIASSRTLVYVVSCVPTIDGTKQRKPTKTSPQRTRIRNGACQLCGIVREEMNRRGASLARGVMSSTTKSAMNGSPAGSPASQGTSTTYYVANAPAMPITNPPA
jgi:hypothetical protein